LDEVKNRRGQIESLLDHAEPRDAPVAQREVPVELERLRDAVGLVVSVDRNGDDDVVSTGLGMDRVNLDVRAEIELVVPLANLSAAMLLSHVHEDGVIGEGCEQRACVALLGRVEEGSDRLRKIVQVHDSPLFGYARVVTTTLPT
jgi:hypothetical protein